MTFETLFAVAFVMALVLAFVTGYAVAHMQVMAARRHMVDTANKAVSDFLKNVREKKDA